MKRDYDLIRDLLFQVERSSKNAIDQSPWHVFKSDKESNEVINYHVRLMKEQGLFFKRTVTLKSKDSAGRPVAKFLPDALSSKGQDFLDEIRNPEVWKKTKGVAEDVGSFGFELVKNLAEGFVKTEVKKRTGIDL